MNCRERIFKILDALGPQTAADLAVEASVHVVQVRTALRELKAKDRVHVTEWTRCRGNPIATWSTGYGRNARKPEPLTNAVKQKAQRAKFVCPPGGYSIFNVGANL